MRRILDLYCGAGGAATGYRRVWPDAEIVGVDNRPQPRYPFRFVQADALDYPLDGFDLIHASPPCQAFTRAGRLRDAQGGTSRSGDLLTPTLARLVDLDPGTVWVVENVEGAPMPDPVLLCGSMFGLAVRRHRLFSSSSLILRGACDHRAQGRPVGVYHQPGDEIPNGGRTARTVDEGRAAMGIDWMIWDELKEAVPPAYTEWIGRQL